MNGRHKQATYVLLHLTGAVVGFAGLSIGSRRFIGDVGKVKMPYGLLHFKNCGAFLPNSGRVTGFTWC